MSGSGRVSLPLIEAGIPLTCVDFSAGLLEILRRKLAARQLAADMHDGQERVCRSVGAAHCLDRAGAGVPQAVSDVLQGCGDNCPLTDKPISCISLRFFMINLISI